MKHPGCEDEKIQLFTNKKREDDHGGVYDDYNAPSTSKLEEKICTMPSSTGLRQEVKQNS